MQRRELIQELLDATIMIEKKGKDYGDTQYLTGEILFLLFPNGLNLQTIEDYNEFNTFFMMITKLCRFVNLYYLNPSEVNCTPLDDTLLDLGNYAFILKNLILNRNSSKKYYSPDMKENF